MAFWSGETLAERLPKLISEFDADMIDCSAYTLTVGPEVYITPDHKIENSNNHTATFLNEGESFAVPPGQFGFLLTEETVHVPDDAMAFISMKSTIKFQGLLNASGFHVDPGFNGRLIFSVFNAGPRSIHLKRGQKLFLIWYANLDVKTKYKKSDSNQQTIPSELVNKISGEIQSVHSLTHQIQSIQANLDNLSNKTNSNSVLLKVICTLAVGVFLLAIPLMINYVRSIEEPEQSTPIESTNTPANESEKTEKLEQQ